MELVRHIVDEAARLVPPGRLTFHWSHACRVKPYTASPTVLATIITWADWRIFFVALKLLRDFIGIGATHVVM